MKPKRHDTSVPVILRPSSQLDNLEREANTNGKFAKKGHTAHRGSAKQRLLEAACMAFAEQGFHGASIREICEHADANIAAANYYFHGKDKLYAAVVERAVQQLRAKPADYARQLPRRTPQQKLRAAIASLFECLLGTTDSVWLLRLIARELAEQGPGFVRIAAALRTHAARLEEPLQQLLGPRTSRHRIHLCALNVTSQCVFFCSTQESLHRLCPQLAPRFATREQLLAHIARFTIAAIEGMGATANTTRMNAAAKESSRAIDIDRSRRGIHSRESD